MKYVKKRYKRLENSKYFIVVRSKVIINKFSKIRDKLAK